MGDRMFASEGDSADVGRPESRAWDGRANRARGSATGPGVGADLTADAGGDAAAGVIGRLQARVDRHRWLLGRMQGDTLSPEPAGLPELLETVHRMRRDTESLLMLLGRDPGVGGGGVRRLSDVLGDGVGASESPHRVAVAPVPAATVSGSAATELLHVLAELVDHVSAVFPDSRVEVSCHVPDAGGMVVELWSDGDARHDPDGHRALDAAQRLAQRSLSGLVVRTPSGFATSGPVVTIHCPGPVVILDAAVVEPDPWLGTRPDVARPASLLDGPGGYAGPAGPAPSALDLPLSDLPPLAEPLFAQPPFAEPRFLEPRFADPLFAESPFAEGSSRRPVDPLFGPPPSGPSPSDRPRSEPDPDRFPLDRWADDPAPAAFPEPDRFDRADPATHPALDPAAHAADLPTRTNGSGDGPANGRPHPAPVSLSPVDELFGPLLALDHDPTNGVVATPIFEAIASAWFREDAVPAQRNGPADGEPEPRQSANGRPRENGRYASGSPGDGQSGNGREANGYAGTGRHGGERESGAGHRVAVRDDLGGHERDGDRGVESPRDGDGAEAVGERSGPRNWQTPSDSEWWAAAERAARPEPEAQGPNELPRRRPGDQLVPPPRRGGGMPEPEQPERVPDRVRDRLSTYQRGLRQGRHRAEPVASDPGDPAAW